MEIEVGEYVRTNKGNIGQVIDIFEGHCIAKYHIQFQGNVKVKRQYLSTNTIVKHSKIISEIVEAGDYVNGYYVRKIANYNNELCAFDLNVMQWIPLAEIDVFYSIVTHEQMANIEYKVETEDK